MVKMNRVNYSARYETNKNKLRRFVFEINSKNWKN